MGAFSNMDYELQNSEAAVSDAFTEDDDNIVPAFLCGVSVDFLDAAAVQTEPHENMGPIRLFSQFDRHC